MEQVYTYDLTKFVKRLTPPRWRTKFNLSWYETLLSPIEYSQDRFNNYRNDANRLLSYNGQTIYLQKMLNDYFDPIQNRILIEHEESNSTYLYLESEGQAAQCIYRENETGHTQLYLYQEGEIANSLGTYDFIVKAPSILSGSTAQMRSRVDLYKLAGVTYNIIFS